MQDIEKKKAQQKQDIDRREAVGLLSKAALSAPVISVLLSPSATRAQTGGGGSLGDDDDGAGPGF